MFKPLAFIVLVITPLLTNAADLAGVWKGTLGKSAVTACFNDAESHNGSYYYQRILTPITLTLANDSTPWVEQGNTGLWTLGAPQGDTLKGLWNKTADAKPLPIALKRTSTPNEGCGSDAYNAPLESAPLPVKTERASFGDHTYVLKTQGGQVTLKLDGDDPAIQKINQQLAALAAHDSEQADYFRERRESLNRSGSSETSEIVVEPTYWSTQWVTVRFYHWAAGTGASGISWARHSWNLQTGERVDPWEWIGGHQQGTAPYHASVKLSDKLSKWLAEQATQDENCPAFTSYSRLDLTFNTQGLHIATPASGDGCDDELTFTWDELKPVLTAKGNAALPSLKTP